MNKHIRIHPSLVRGLGIGIPLVDIMDDKKKIAEAIDRAGRQTKATWYQTWLPEPSETGYVYMQFTPAAEDGGANLSLETINKNHNACWLILNEIETGWHPNIRTPKRAWRETKAWLTRMLNTEHTFAWVAPNSNINGDNFKWFAEYASLLTLRGNTLPSAWGVHVYGWPVSAVNHHWRNFMRWWEENGCGVPIVVTEFGAGPNTNAEQNIAVLEWMCKEMITNPAVVAAAFFAYRRYTARPDVVYIGLEDSPLLLSEFNKWADVINRHEWPRP